MNQAVVLSRPFAGLRRNATQMKSRAESLWRAYPREVLGLGLFTVAAAAAIGTSALPSFSAHDTARAAPPAPPAMIVRPLAPDQALKLNAEIPVTGGPNPAAAPFRFKGDAAARSQALTCLASIASIASIAGIAGIAGIACPRRGG